MLETQRKFWLVYCPQGTMPKVEHPSYEKARLEAERLARIHPEKHFYTLETKAVSYQHPIPVVTKECR